jgi:hypothetical protein
MIAADQVAELAALLGTAEDLARVNIQIELLGDQLMNSENKPTRNELIRMMTALDLLSAGILSMDRVARDLMGGTSAGAVDCVG